jgi:aspartyl-tRNA(Asn)/glutamyl-tRNA(Gln) amidotransferase subunit B
MPDSPYRVVIGLEVHVQLLTKTKLFCGCSTQFGLPPNSATCPVCIGMPGVLPVMNRQAFDLALKAALALNCHIAEFTKWDRKNYYYPDLPKNYQISQYDLPFSHDGWLEIETGETKKRIRIIRVHLEEDAGKLMHDEDGRGRESLVDLNRAGTPLLEIVSHPDMASPEEAKAFLEEIRLLLKELEVSDCEMQEGSLRCDANVNIHLPLHDGTFAATPIVEVKNLNSFRAVERAIKYEAQRQYGQFQKDGKKLGEASKATAGWNDAKGVTVIQRRKEEASDYRYFPEPDLVPAEVDDAWLQRTRSGLGELPAMQRVRLESQYALSPYDAGVLTRQGRSFVTMFEEIAKLSGDAKAASNWITNEVLQSLNQRNWSVKEFPLTPYEMAGLINKVKETGLNKQRARELYERMLEKAESRLLDWQPVTMGGLPRSFPRAPQDAYNILVQAIDELGFKVVGDSSQLREMVQRAIAANPKAVADFKKGKTKAADAIKGAVMRETKGMAKMEMVQQLVMEEMEKA